MLRYPRLAFCETSGFADWPLLILHFYILGIQLVSFRPKCSALVLARIPTCNFVKDEIKTYFVCSIFVLRFLFSTSIQKHVRWFGTSHSLISLPFLRNTSVSRRGIYYLFYHILFFCNFIMLSLHCREFVCTTPQELNLEVGHDTTHSISSVVIHCCIANPYSDRSIFEQLFRTLGKHSYGCITVSYTHLTLPTIYSV